MSRGRLCRRLQTRCGYPRNMFWGFFSCRQWLGKVTTFFCDRSRGQGVGRGKHICGPWLYPQSLLQKQVEGSLSTNHTYQYQLNIERFVNGCVFPPRIRTKMIQARVGRRPLHHRHQGCRKK